MHWSRSWSYTDQVTVHASFIWTSVFLVCSFICVVFLFLFIIFFFNLLCLKSPFPRLQGKLNSFLEEGWILSFGFCPTKVGPVVCVSFLNRVIFVLNFCLFFSWWARVSEVVILSADDLVCIFVLFVCLDEASCTGCYWWLSDAGSCIIVVSFVWILSIWYLLGLVL